MGMSCFLFFIGLQGASPAIVHQRGLELQLLGSSAYTPFPTVLPQSTKKYIRPNSLVFMPVATKPMPTEEEIEDVILACRYGDLEDVRQFVDTHGVVALADARDERKNSALHMCCANGHEG